MAHVEPGDAKDCLTESFLRIYGPQDVDDAHAEWKSNCGPASLAAILNRRLSEVRPWFPNFPAKPWVNPTAMKAALAAAGAKWRVGSLPFYWPVNGLAHLQWEGSWLQPGVPAGAAYRRTHWIAVRSRNYIPGTDRPPAVYDVNAAYWMTRPEWEQEILPLLLAANKGATGWHVRLALEVEVS